MIDNIKPILILVMEIAGPIALAIVLAFAIMQNRKRSKSEREQTDMATRRLYD